MLCCSAVKSNIHFRINAQNVSYFQLMWKLVPFFRKIEIIRKIKLIFCIENQLSKPNFGYFWSNLLKSLQIKSKIYIWKKNLHSVGCALMCPKSELMAFNVLDKLNHFIFFLFDIHCCVNCFKFYRQKLCFFLYPHLGIKSKTNAYRRHLL